MTDKVNFEYDINADFDNVLSGNSEKKTPAVAKPGATQKKVGAVAGGKMEPWNDVPEPAFVNQTGLTINVPVADPDKEHLQVLKDDQYLQHYEGDIK